MTPAELRSILALNLAETAATLLLNPKPPRKLKEKVAALKGLRSAYDDLLRATSTSNPGYEIRDVPVAEREAVEKSDHVLRLLDAMVTLL